MGKRKRNEDYYNRKIRKMESKLRKLKDSQNNSEDEASHLLPPSQTPPLSSQSGHKEPLECVLIEDDINIPIDDDQLPEELLLALGNEGEEKEDFGEPIRPELALRWTKIMAEGLGKEARSNILSKYNTPSNFPNEIAPTMNPEIMASMSEPSIKRDRRIVTRQNLTGKLMTCLGRSLTNILKGNINTKLLVEEINDAAKIAAEIHNQDSSSRKFFALSGANKTVQEAVKNSKIDKFLFGTDCAEKIKFAQSIQRTGAQITDIKKNKQPAAPKKQLNWKGPPQNQQPQHQQARGGQYPRQQVQYRRQPRLNPRQTDWRRPPTKSKSRHNR